MKEMYRTMIFGAVAIVSVILALLTAHYSEPRLIEQFAEVGKPFFPEFTEPADARSLEVIVIDKAAKKPRTFRVEYKDGLWRIPSHHGYPVEAKDRLARTAASVMGIVRESLAGRRKEQHARFGVIDPGKKGIEDPEEVGKRITLRRADGTVLADFIIGKKADVKENNENFRRSESPDEKVSPLYYVRRPDEKETYRARLEIDLSTKFSEWIKPNLLKVGREANFRELVTTKYAFKKMRRQVGPFVEIGMDRDPMNDEVNRLRRENFTWHLDGLDTSTEELNSFHVDDLVRVLRKLNISGVRPKPKFQGKPMFTADFRINVPQGGATREFVSAFRGLQSDLEEKGFRLIPLETDPTRAQMFSMNGQVTAASNEGIVYYLYFGEVIMGDETEIEIGGTEPAVGKSAAGAKNSKYAKTAGKPKKKDGAVKSGGNSTTGDDNVKKNRYLYLRVEFNEKYLMNKPVRPVEPVKPDPLPVKAARPKSAKKEPTGKPNTAKKGDGSNDARNAFPENNKDKPKTEFERKLEEYESAKKAYDKEIVKHSTDMNEYSENVRKGKRKVRELNDRFADWYYVISSASFKNLRLTRKDLVNKKKLPEEKKKPKQRTETPVKARRPKAAKKVPAK
ncbi:MAG: hypothetical protein IID45_02110 [Planctomycetes bacterium]|nr:hypothetical protein [Planctomycetota bacterium]